jgi:hypothetical protein
MTKSVCRPEGPDAECTDFTGAEFLSLVVNTLYPLYVSYVVLQYAAFPLVGWRWGKTKNE